MLEHEMDKPNTHTEAELDTAYAAGYNAGHDIEVSFLRGNIEQLLELLSEFRDSRTEN